MKWINLPIYTDVKLHPIINRGQTYNGQSITTSAEGIVLSYPSAELVDPYQRPVLCLNPRFLYANGGYYDGLTGDSYYNPVGGTDLIGVSNNRLFFGGFQHLSIDGYRADSPYYYTEHSNETITSANLGTVQNIYLYSIEVKFAEGIPEDKLIQLEVAGHKSLEEYSGVGAGQTLLFTWDGKYIPYGTIEFTDSSLTSAVAKASYYERSGSNYSATEYPAIAINGYYSMRGLLFTGRYILGVDIHNRMNLLYSELPINIKSIYIGEEILTVGHYKDSIFVFTKGSVFETNLARTNRLCNMIPETEEFYVVSTDVGIYALAHNSVYFLQSYGFKKLVHFDFQTFRIAPSWTNQSVYVMTGQGLYEVSLQGVWKLNICPEG